MFTQEIMVISMKFSKGDGGRNSHRDIAGNGEDLADGHVWMSGPMGEIMNQNV